MCDAGRTPYGVLGVAEGASFSEVKRAYWRKARATHRHPCLSGSVRSTRVLGGWEPDLRDPLKPEPEADLAAGDLCAGRVTPCPVSGFAAWWTVPTRPARSVAWRPPLRGRR